MKKIIIGIIMMLTLVMCMAFGVSADENCIDGTCLHGNVVFINASEDQNYTYCKRVHNIIFSEGVTHISPMFSYGCTNLEYVTFSSTITFIGSGAFRDSKISSVVLPEGLTTLGGGAFMGCKNLTDVYIPSTINSTNGSGGVGGSAIGIGGVAPFEDTNVKNLTIALQNYTLTELGLTEIETLTLTENITNTDDITGGSSLDIDECPNLAAIYVDENNPYYSSEDGVLFNKEKTEIIFYPPQKTDKEYKIPDGVKTIRTFCFKNNDYLKKIDLPDSLKVIESDAFSIPVEELSVIPKTVEKIDAFAFTKHCLTDVYFEGTTAEWKEITVNMEIEIPSGTLAFYSFSPDVIPHCKGDTDPDSPDEPEIPEDHTHSFTSGVIVEATCTEDGVMSLSCLCGYSFSELIPATGHKDENGDYKCDNDGCDYEFEKPAPADCSCNCHKSGFMGFIWKILRIFYKLFKINPVCGCGIAHY